MPVNTIAMPRSSAAAITSSSRTLPPGWITATAPLSATTSSPSRNGKNASDADDRAGERQARVLRLHRRDPRRVDAAHLAGADAERAPARAVDDGVGLDELGDAPGEQQVVLLRGRRRLPRDDPELGRQHVARVRASARAGRRRPASSRAAPARAPRAAAPRARGRSSSARSPRARRPCTPARSALRGTARRRPRASRRRPAG